MRRLVQRSRAGDPVRRDTRSYSINSVNLFIHRKRDKKRVRRRVKTRKSLFI